MARRPDISNPNCPKCGGKSVRQGSVHGRKRCLCKDCSKSFGSNALGLFPYQKTSTERIIEAILVFLQERSFRATARITGHRPESISKWVFFLVKHWSKAASSCISIFKKLGVETHTFGYSLREICEELNNKKASHRKWDQVCFLPLKTRPDIGSLVPLISKANESVAHVSASLTREALEVLYEPLWKTLAPPNNRPDSPFSEYGEKLLIELYKEDRDLAYNFIQTLPQVTIALEQAGQWTKALAYLEKIAHLVDHEQNKFNPLYLARECLISSWKHDYLKDWCYAKKSQYLHKRNPEDALQMAEKREHFQAININTFKKSYHWVLADNERWMVYLQLRSERVNPKKILEKVDELMQYALAHKNYSLMLSLNIYKARIHSLEARKANSKFFERQSFMKKMKDATDKVLDILELGTFPELCLIETYVDISQIYQPLLKPDEEEGIRLRKASQSCIIRGYAGQAKKLLDLKRAKRFTPDNETIGALQNLAKTISSADIGLHP